MIYEISQQKLAKKKRDTCPDFTCPVFSLSSIDFKHVNVGWVLVVLFLLLQKDFQVSQKIAFPN